MSRSWTVACLAGDGVGPELMGEASRVLAEVARLHALRIDDVHLPFGGEAMTRVGHPLPLSTRNAYRSADAVFVSSPDDPAFDGVKADLDLAWRVSRVHNDVRGDLVVVEPVGYGSDELAVARAFQLAAARRARLTSVGSSSEWTELITAEATIWDGLEVEHLTLGGVLTRFRDHPGTVDLVVAGSHLAQTARASSRPRSARRTRSPGSASPIPRERSSQPLSSSARVSARAPPRERWSARSPLPKKEPCSTPGLSPTPSSPTCPPPAPIPSTSRRCPNDNATRLVWLEVSLG